MVDDPINKLRVANMNSVLTYKSIYENVFCNTFNKACYVFLCGGAGKDNIRNNVRIILEQKRLQVLYPEDLFIEMLNKDKKADLLEYENLLAENSDFVCIICESFGSAVELGAFIQNENIKRKLIIAVNQKHKRDKSFIMTGPVKHLKKINSERVIFYKVDDPENLGQLLSKLIRKSFKHINSNRSQSFGALSAYIAFIPMIIYFYQTVSRKVIHHHLKDFLRSKDMLPVKYNELFNVAVKYLLKDGVLTTDFNLEEKDERLSLSNKGFDVTCRLISNSYAPERTILHDKIRCTILREQLYK